MRSLFVLCIIGLTVLCAARASTDRATRIDVTGFPGEPVLVFLGAQFADHATVFLMDSNRDIVDQWMNPAKTKVEYQMPEAGAVYTLVGFAADAQLPVVVADLVHTVLVPPTPIDIPWDSKLRVTVSGRVGEPTIVPLFDPHAPFVLLDAAHDKVDYRLRSDGVEIEYVMPETDTVYTLIIFDMRGNDVELALEMRHVAEEPVEPQRKESIRWTRGRHNANQHNGLRVHAYGRVGEAGTVYTLIILDESGNIELVLDLVQAAVAPPDTDLVHAAPDPPSPPPGIPDDLTPSIRVSGRVGELVRVSLIVPTVDLHGSVILLDADHERVECRLHHPNGIDREYVMPETGTVYTLITFDPHGDAEVIQIVHTAADLPSPVPVDSIEVEDEEDGEYDIQLMEMLERVYTTRDAMLEREADRLLDRHRRSILEDIIEQVTALWNENMCSDDNAAVALLVVGLLELIIMRSFWCASCILVMTLWQC